MSGNNQIDREQLARMGVIIRLNGKPYLTHDGLLRVAHDNGLASIETELVSWDPEARAAVVKATAVGTRGTFSDYGDACPDNVNRAIASACLRMSSTRAVSRCLRLYTGIGLTCTSELPGNRPDASIPQEPEPARPVKQHQAPAEDEPLTPLMMLRSTVKDLIKARKVSELDMLARYFRQVNDTNEPYWENWKELEADEDGPEWALGRVRRLIAQEGLQPPEILQAAIDAHGGR